MQRYACITLDLEPDHAGYAPEAYEAWALDKTESLLSLLKKYKVELSIFIVTKSLNKNINIIEAFKDSGAEFHLHTHTHTISKSDTPEEIKKGKEEFIKFFKQDPLGFRAPRGFITKKGLDSLRDEGFIFDSSVIPSFWPNLNFFSYPSKPYRDKNNLLEIPFSTISPFKFVISLSWIRLFGWSFYKLLFNIFSLPNPLIFTFHLHDLWRVENYNDLPFSWKLKYIRNKKNGLFVLETFLKYLTSEGFEHKKLSELINNYPI